MSSSKFCYNPVLFIYLTLSLFNYVNASSKEPISPDEGKLLINELNSERKNFLVYISDEEDKCLKLFLSGPCLERLIVKHDTQIREFDLKKQNILRNVRYFESNLRKQKRENRIKKRNKY